MRLSIGELAAELGVGASAIRYYERMRLVPRPGRSGGKRVYNETEAACVKALVGARRLGFNIDELRRLSSSYAANDTAALKRTIALKIVDLDRELQQLRARRAALVPLASCGCPVPSACAWENS